MNYELLFPEQGTTSVRYALTGANGGFARSLRDALQKGAIA